MAHASGSGGPPPVPDQVRKQSYQKYQDPAYQQFNQQYNPNTYNMNQYNNNMNNMNNNNNYSNNNNYGNYNNNNNNNNYNNYNNMNNQYNNSNNNNMNNNSNVNNNSNQANVQPMLANQGSINQMQQQMSKPNTKTWVEQQEQAFRGWINAHLAARQINAIPKGQLPYALSTVVPLIHLLEILGNGPLPQIKDYHKNPKFNIQFLEGLRICLKQIQMRDSTKGQSTHFDPEELLKGQDLKIALALAWRIICNYSIQEYDPVYGASSKELSTPEDKLLWWCNQRLPPHQQVSNFTTDFQSGMALVQLINQALDDDARLKEQDVEDLDGEDLLGGVFHVADEQLAIPKLLDVNDVLYNPDRQSIMTYVTLIRTAVTNKEKERLGKMALQNKLDSSKQFHQTEMAKLQEGNRALTSKLENLEKQKNIIENQLNDEKKAHSTTREEMESTISQLKSQLEDLQRKMEDTEQKQDSQQLNAMMGNDIELLKQDVEKYKKQNDELNAKVAEMMAQELEKEHTATKGGGPNDTAAEVAALQKQIDEMKSYYEGKVRQVEQDWEKNRQEFLAYAQDLQQRLNTSNTLGRQFRAKSSELEDEKTKLNDKIRQLELDLGDKDAQLMSSSMKIEELQASMESQEAVFKIQLQELGTFIKQLKAKEQEKQENAMNDMKMQYGMANNGMNNDYNNNNGYGNVAPAAAAYGGGGGGVGGGGNMNNGGYGGGGGYNDRASMSADQYQVAQQGGGGMGHVQGQASIDNVNVMQGDQAKLKPFDRRLDSVRTKLGRERVVITWAYQSSNGKQHVIILKHDTKTNMNKESKRVIYVDGAKKYDAKSNITNWYIQLGMGQNEDRIRISIHETDSRSYDYTLSINERPFEELYAEWQQSQQEQQQIQGGFIN